MCDLSECYISAVYTLGYSEFDIFKEMKITEPVMGAKWNPKHIY
jgi:hypothetical protein